VYVVKYIQYTLHTIHNTTHSTYNTQYTHIQTHTHVPLNGDAGLVTPNKQQDMCWKKYKTYVYKI